MYPPFLDLVCKTIIRKGRGKDNKNLQKENQGKSDVTTLVFASDIHFYLKPSRVSLKPAPHESPSKQTLMKNPQSDMPPVK